MKRVLIAVREGNGAAQEAYEELESWLKKRKVDYLRVPAGNDCIDAKLIKGVGLGVIIGGDGTFLGVVRRLEQKDAFPLLGVNLGTLGFITDIGRNEMPEVMGRIFDGDFEEQRRHLLQVELWRKGKLLESATVLNDTALTKDARTSMLNFDVFVGGEFFNRIGADGFIVSTATGSTAYGMSAGGPIVHPGVNGLVLNAICSHTLSSRPVVIPVEMEVEIRMSRRNEGEVYLVCDGQVSFNVLPEDRIKIQGSDKSVRMIRRRGQKWSETLRTKLNMA